MMGITPPKKPGFIKANRAWWVTAYHLGFRKGFWLVRHHPQKTCFSPNL